MEANKIDVKSIKIGLLGDSLVGKSYILAVYNNFDFASEYFCRTTTEKFEKKININNGKNIKLIMWYVTGQERFRKAVFKTIRSVHGIILVFDYTSRKSLENLDIWLQEIKDNLNDVIVVLFGNKIDIEKEKWEVTNEEARKYARKMNIAFFETSAKLNQGINEGFNYIANEAYLNIVKKIKENKNLKIENEKDKNEKCVGKK